MKILRLHFTRKATSPKRPALLYRTFALVPFLALLCAPMLLAQHQRAALRALGLLELAPSGHARLVPVGILVNGKWYDASIYRADPRPLALDPGTVYEAERSGASRGLFTITNTANFKEVWVGLGQWRSNEVLALANQEKSQTTSSASSKLPIQADDQRPILRRPESERVSAAPPGKDASAAPAPQSTAAKQEAETAASDSDDSGRPILRRGKPASKQEVDEIPPVTFEKPGAAGVAAQPGAAKLPSQIQVLPAISDATGPQPQSYAIKLSDADRTAFQETAGTMAYQAIQKFAAIHRLHKPGAATALGDISFAAFDLQRNGQPTIVLSASLPEASTSGSSTTAAPTNISEFRYYVTVVAQRDLYGHVNQLFAHVTDSTNLDVYPRMELIDAVDAEGAGSGQLLFRRIGDTEYRFTIYRAGMNKLAEVFASTTRSF